MSHLQGVTLGDPVHLGLRRRAVVLAPLLAVAAGARAAAPVIPLALPDGINLPQVRTVLDFVARQAGVTWDLQFVPVPRMLAMVENGWTLGFGAGRASRQASRLMFSDEVFVSGIWPIARGEIDHDLRVVEDLKDLRVCMVRGLDYGRGLEEAKGSLFSAEYVTGDFRTRVRQLMAGRCDVLLATHFNMDASLLRQRIAESGGSLDKLKLSGAPLSSLALRFVGAKSSAFSALIPGIDQAVRINRKEIAQLLSTKE